MTALLSQVLNDLSARVRQTPSGAKSLAHIAVVVPTAQSGRRLRRALAERWGALIPPLVKTPIGMLLDKDDQRLAGRTDELRAMKKGLEDAGIAGGLKYAKTLVDLRMLLVPKALLFADVANAIATDLPEEAERWRRFADIEEKYLAALATSGKNDRITAIKGFDATTTDIEETLDYSALDEKRWAPPRGESTVGIDQIIPCATPADEAARIADYFTTVKPTEALPALCITDPELFPEIETAFKTHGLKIHNPSETKLAASSLGHLVAQIVALSRTQSYDVFSAFVRGGDARRWLQRELRLSDEDFTSALIDLDNRQAEYLPEKIDDLAPKTSGTLRGIFEFVKAQLRKKGLRAILAAIFKDFLLDERENASREFAAAAEAVNTLIGECGDDLELFEMRLKESTYSLEPDEGEVILTDGWMELPFLETRELVIAGFQEGCVPESTVGHPYLPDSLRHRLGLPDNAFKTARDRTILALAARCRSQQELKIFFHSVDAKGEVKKPSRLLLETADDADLLARVKRFYGVHPGSRTGAARDLPNGWKLSLPIPPRFRELKKISPTRLDSYLRCPFTYYLKDKEILGDKRMDDRAEELQAWEYGNLVHTALEAFGLSELKDSTDAERVRAFLEEKVDRQLVERFGASIPAIVALQGESAKRRLGNFAEIQSIRRKDGWRIFSVERKFELVYAHTRLYGKCDRIDFNDRTGEWCVIDYKTWDKAERPKTESIQLPIYCAMLDAAQDEDLKAAKRDQISSCYCILGKTRDNVLFTSPTTAAILPEVEAKIRVLIDKIEHGIFWPPNAAGEWKYDYADWLDPRPEESIDEAWIRDQEARMGNEVPSE